MDSDSERTQKIMEAYERKLKVRKEYYIANRDRILAGMKEKYDAAKREREESGVPPARRGRPRKYPAEEK